MIPDGVAAKLRSWAETHPSINRVWAFGSRARGAARSDSELDIAVELTPDDGNPDAEWIEMAACWRRELTALVATPAIDLWSVGPEDRIVRSAIKADGVLIYERL